MKATRHNANTTCASTFLLTILLGVAWLVWQPELFAMGGSQSAEEVSVEDQYAEQRQEIKQILRSPFSDEEKTRLLGEYIRAGDPREKVDALLGPSIVMVMFSALPSETYFGGLSVSYHGDKVHSFRMLQRFPGEQRSF